MKRFLVIVDIQNDFVDGALGTKEAEAIIDNAVGKINGFSGDVFVTYDTHFDNYLETSEGSKLPVPHCIRGTTGWELNSRIASALKDRTYTTVEKVTFGSMELPKLIAAAAAGDELEITLIGLCTDICVVSNALILKASFPEARIIVEASCCAGVTVDSHNAALNTMIMCQIEVVNK